MKVYISVDMEGVSGVTHLEHTSESGFDYQRARRLMTAETNAAIEGALAGGATEILVNDGHGGNGNRNLVLEDLHPSARLLTGRPRPGSQVCGLDSSYDALMMVGYHVMAGAVGNLAHTINGPVVFDLKVNGRSVGEVGLNAYMAGELGVPTVLVTGDDCMALETKEFMPQCETAVVKTATGYNSADCLPPECAQRVIRDAAKRSLVQLKEMQPLVCETPATFELTCHHPGMADAAGGVPGAERVDGLRLRFVSQTFAEGHETVNALIRLGMWNAMLPGRR